MIRYGFSGTRSITTRQQTLIDGVLDSLPSIAEYTTGACIGVDAYIGRKLWHDRPNATHRVVVPADQSRIDYWWTHRAIRDAGPWRGVELEEMPLNTSYKDRNQRIVAHSDVLMAFPAYPEHHPHSARSGTWQTVRMARRAGLEVLVTVLNDNNR